MEYPKLSHWKQVDDLRRHIAQLGLSLPVDDGPLSAADGSPLAKPIEIGGIRVGNRWCVLPMEGWDAERDGSPSEWTLRRWRNFGLSGAKLIWGGEAAAVEPAGRANPNQTLAVPENRAGLRRLLDELLGAHRASFGGTDDLLVGLQLTHSGRYCRPNRKDLTEPRIPYHHPLLDKKFGIDPRDDSMVWTDDELERLIDRFVASARLAADVGFQFVDVKACHGYLVHEFLSAWRRPGRFGGDFQGRTHLLRTIIERIRGEIPDLRVAVRLGAYDGVPYQTSRDVGRPMAYEEHLPYDLGFGVDPQDPRRSDLSEPIELLKVLQGLGVVAVNISCGSPYYNPHVQRPAMYPPSDGYQPPEDPLAGVIRQIDIARLCKEAVPGLPVVGTGYSYLQEFLPHVAQAVVRQGWIDLVGLGRMILAYPTLPADVLAGRSMDRKRICRTFSDCTTAPRNGMISGCFPLDPNYKDIPEAQRLKEIKKSL